uniref:Atrial natriuretic peptide transcript variant 1 n=1 Tax=Ophionotus victoriae TaxID=667017 RepID=A0A220W0C4_9ECHI|nr:atrial natriuretic peptide precursor transcript variant 1 [Ophionotus victoriae]
MKSLTLTIFVVLASFVLLTHALEDDEAADLMDQMLAQLSEMKEKRARNKGCNTNLFMDHIGSPAWCRRKRSRILPKLDDME